MAIYQGTYYSQPFAVTDINTGLPVSISGWTFSADFRVNLTDANPPLLALTSGAGGFTITDAANGKFTLNIAATQTAALPVGHLLFDVLRTDASPGPLYMFGAKCLVKEPVTR